jgi:hypothetical protein
MNGVERIIAYIRGLLWVPVAAVLLIILFTLAPLTRNLVYGWTLFILLPAWLSLYSGHFGDNYIGNLPRWCMFLLAVIPSGLLILAQDHWPYDYYVILRWAVLIAGAILAVSAHRLKRRFLFWVMVSVVVLFNPIAPFHFKKSIWVLFDGVAALVIGWSWMSFVEHYDIDVRR